MNILLFHNDVERFNLIAFCLESQLKYNVNQVSSLESAMTFLLGDSPINLLVVGHSEETNSLFKFLMSSNGKIPIIHLQSAVDSQELFPELNFVGRFKESEAPEKLVEIIKSKFPRGALSEEESGDFVRINIQLLLRVVPLKGDGRICKSLRAKLSLTKHIGFTPQVAEITKTAVSATLKMISSAPSLSSLVFSSLQKKELSFEP
jgi:hypothetical protein